MTYRLTLLGNLDLRDSNGAPIQSVLQQPRRLALLVYLALQERDVMVKRDTLLGLFWPEMPQENGRRALSQAIHFLRRSLGSDSILARGNDDIALNGAVVECDATTFLAAVKARDVRAASAAYAGDLIPGFFVAGVHEIEEWIATTRDSLRRTAAEVFWSAAEEARQQGQAVSAAASARRAAELASDNETATRRLMEFLDALDDRAGALDAYDALVRKLEAEFESTPSAKTRELAERIRRKGEVIVTTRAEAADEITIPRSPLSRLPWREISTRGRNLAGAGIMMAAFLSLWGLSRKNHAPAVEMDASVAVEDAKVFDPALRDVASSITSDVSSALVEVPHLRVATDAVTAQEARGVHFVLKPNVTTRDGQIYVVASLIDEGTHTIVRSASFTAKAHDEASMSALAADVSEFARKAMGRHMRQSEIESIKAEHAGVLMQAGMARIKADSLLTKGVADYAVLTLNHADSVVSMTSGYERSVDLLVARAELARFRAWAYAIPPLADRAKMNAISEEGIKYADAAIGLDKANSNAQELRGLFAFYQWFFPARQDNTTAAHRDEALRYLQSAVQLNPESGRAWSALALILNARGEFPQAYLAAEKAQASDTYLEDESSVVNALFRSALETGDVDAASRACDDMSRRASGYWVRTYCGLQLVAWSTKISRAEVARADHMVADVVNAGKNDPFVVVFNSILAVIHAKAGDVAGASALLKTSDSGPMAEEAMPFRAWALHELGRNDQARSVLNAYVAKDPSTRAGFKHSARFTDL